MPNCCDHGFGHGEWAFWPISPVFGGAIVVGVTLALVKGEKMDEAIGSGNPRKTRVMVLVAVLVLVAVALVSVLQPAQTTDANTPGTHPGVHAPSTGGRGVPEDSYIERHPEVVAANQQGSHR